MDLLNSNIQSLIKIFVLFRLYVKGGESENIVVCTNDSTFELKEAETSNSLLVMPSLAEATAVEVHEERKLKSQSVFTLD